MHAKSIATWPLLLAIAAVLISALPSQSAPTKWMISGYVQGRYTQTIGEEGNPPLAFPTETFNVNRAYINMHAAIDDHIGANIMIGGVPKAVVYEAYGEYIANPFQARLGLSRVPYGYEVPLSSARLITTERAQVSQKLVAPYTFDRGIFGYYLPGKGFNVSLGVTNGRPTDLTTVAPANQVENNTKKTFIGRLGAYVLNGQLGVSLYTGANPGVLNAPERNLNVWDVDFETTQGPFTLISEYQQGTSGADVGATSIVTKPRGGYATLAYQHTNSPSQPYLRYDAYDPNRDAVNDYFQRWTAGYNYYLNPASKITGEYESISDKLQPELKGRFTAQYQVMF